MSYYRGPAYPPRKRARGGANSLRWCLTADYYDGGDRYNRGPPRQSLEESVLTRFRKDFISLADPVFRADVYWLIVETSDDSS